MVTDVTAQAVVFTGCLAGVAFRTLYPYFEKIQELEANSEDPIKFLHKYKLTALISLAVSAATALSVVGNVPLPSDSVVNVFGLFTSAFFTGYGANSILNRASFKTGDKIIEKISAQKQAKDDNKKDKDKGQTIGTKTIS